MEKYEKIISTNNFLFSNKIIIFQQKFNFYLCGLKRLSMTVLLPVIFLNNIPHIIEEHLLTEIVLCHATFLIYFVVTS